MSKGTEGHFDTLPIGRLGLIPLNSSAALGKKGRRLSGQLEKGTRQ